jgi:mannosyl-oligosaccharide alpha-1,2-mannosidase
MWPIYVDASGCERIMYKSPSMNIQTDGGSTLTKLDSKGDPLEELPPSIAHSSSKGPTPPLKPKVASDSRPARIKGWDENHPEEKDASKEKFVPLAKPDPLVMDAKPVEKVAKVKRQFDNPALLKELREAHEAATANVPAPNIPPAHASPVAPPQDAVPECVPHGLASQSKWGNEEFTLGSMSDSTYEYLPKASTLLLLSCQSL